MKTKKILLVALIVSVSIILVICSFNFPYSVFSINKEVHIDSTKSVLEYKKNTKMLRKDSVTVSNNKNINRSLNREIFSVLSSSMLKDTNIKKNQLEMLLQNMNKVSRKINSKLRNQPEYFTQNQRSYLVELKKHLEVNSYNTNQLITSSFASKNKIKESIDLLYKGMNQDLEALLALK